jgi:hypothetical protein
MLSPRLRRLLGADFTEQQATAILEAIEGMSDQNVARDYLDSRLREESNLTRDYVELRLREEFLRHKRSMLLWLLVMHAPTYAALIYLSIRIG